MRGSRKFVRGGLNLIKKLIDEGIEDLNTAINGPSSTCQRNAIEMAIRWRADGGTTLNTCLVASRFSVGPDQYYKETLYFCNCAGGGAAP